MSEGREFALDLTRAGHICSGINVYYKARIISKGTSANNRDPGCTMPLRYHPPLFSYQVR